LVVLRADFRAVIEIKARAAECFFFGASVFGTSIPREKANIPREKFNDPEPLRLKGPRTLRRV
jgi:hypothetical protein